MPAKFRIDPVKERFWRDEIEQQQNSGLSGPEFCRQRKYKYSLFADWRTRLQKLDAAGGIPREIREELNLDWLSIIEKARKYPAGVCVYLQENGIDEKLYYRRFRKYRKTHPEWETLTRGGRKPGAKNKKMPAKEKRQVVKEKSVVSHNLTTKRNAAEQVEFAPVHLVEASTKASSPETVEIVLPDSLVIRMSSDCSPEYLASIISAMRGH